AVHLSAAGEAAECAPKFGVVLRAGARWPLAPGPPRLPSWGILPSASGAHRAVRGDYRKDCERPTAGTHPSRQRARPVLRNLGRGAAFVPAGGGSGRETPLQTGYAAIYGRPHNRRERLRNQEPRGPRPPPGCHPPPATHPATSPV